jgi:hypothetical protein
MAGIKITVASGTVTLSGGQGSVAVSVTNTEPTRQRLILGGYPAPGAAGAAPSAAGWTRIDRPIREFGPGAKEQYVAAFDATNAPPGTYHLKFIAYPADDAPEDYSEQGQLVSVTISAPATPPASPRRRLPWLIIAAAVVLVVVIAGVVVFLTRSKNVAVPTNPAAPTSTAVLTNTAVGLNGSSGITVDQQPDLDFVGPITIEAWVKPVTTSTGTNNVVAHGFHQSNPAAEVYLRTHNGAYQVGSWNGTDHVAAAPIPPEDIGSWVHLAGVYNGSAWELYRNGVLLATTVDPVGAIQVPAAWAVGTNAAGDGRFFTGDIDDIRIWNRTLSQQEIVNGMNTRLTGTEPGLAAYLYMNAGAMVDHHANPAVTHAVGTPTQVASPPALTG